VKNIGGRNERTNLQIVDKICDSGIVKTVEWHLHKYGISK